MSTFFFEQLKSYVLYFLVSFLVMGLIYSIAPPKYDLIDLSLANLILAIAGSQALGFVLGDLVVDRMSIFEATIVAVVGLVSTVILTFMTPDSAEMYLSHLLPYAFVAAATVGMICCLLPLHVRLRSIK